MTNDRTRRDVLEGLEALNLYDIRLIREKGELKAKLKAAEEATSLCHRAVNRVIEALERNYEKRHELLNLAATFSE